MSESEESDSDDSEDGNGLSSLTDFLLDFYKGLTPQIFTEDKVTGILDCERKTIGGTSSEKLFSRLAYALDNVDEFVNFKKFFVTALNQDRDRIKNFIEEEPDLAKLTDFVFRCRRIKFSAQKHQEQIRLIYNFQV